MRTLVADTLAAWRQAERVLEQSEVGSPDHETARIAVAELRDLYQLLTERTGLDPTADLPGAEGPGSDVLTRVRDDLGIDPDGRMMLPRRRGHPGPPHLGCLIMTPGC